MEPFSIILEPAPQSPQSYLACSNETNSCASINSTGRLRKTYYKSREEFCLQEAFSKLFRCQNQPSSYKKFRQNLFCLQTDIIFCEVHFHQLRKRWETSVPLTTLLIAGDVDWGERGERSWSVEFKITATLSSASNFRMLARNKATLNGIWNKK